MSNIKEVEKLSSVAKKFERWLYDNMDNVTGRQFYEGGLIVEKIDAFVEALRFADTSEAPVDDTSENAAQLEIDEDSGERVIMRRRLNVL